MHATIYEDRMTEETFQVLLDVMEKHFAALSVPGPADNPKITRAISFSELPTSHRIVYEQCYQADSNTLIKQYSCEQIFDKFSNSSKVKISEVVKTGNECPPTNSWTTGQSLFKIPGNVSRSKLKIGQSKMLQNPNKQQEMETMEIEEINTQPISLETEKSFVNNLPITQLNGMTISGSNSNDRTLIKASTFTNVQNARNTELARPLIRSRSVSPKKCPNAQLTSETPVSPENNFTNVPKMPNVNNIHNGTNSNDITKKLRSLVPNRIKKENASEIAATCYKLMFFLLLSVSVMIFAVLIAQENSPRGRMFDPLNMSSISAKLRSQVRGQDRAIGQLIKEFEKNSNGINLVILVGGTGVGKSYSLGIISKGFDYVFEYFSPLREKIHEVFTAFSTRQCNFVILENQKHSDLPEIAKFINFMRGNTKGLCVFTVAVFNPRETGTEPLRQSELDNSIVNISTFLQEHGLRDTKIIIFDELEEKALDYCIKEAANKNNIGLTQEQFLEIRETLMTVGSGCKGAHAKIQLLSKT